MNTQARVTLVTAALLSVALPSARSQVAWAPRIAARTNAQTLWAVHDASNGRVLSLDRGPAGLLFSEVYKDRTALSIRVPSPLFAHAIAGIVGNAMCVVARDTSGQQITFEWNGQVWSQSSQTPDPLRIPVGDSIFTTRSARYSRLVAKLRTRTLEVEDFVSAQQRWVERSIPLPPPATAQVAAAWSYPRDALLVFDGDRGETWLLKGSTWIKQAGSGPGPRRGAAMCYDSFRDCFVLHGGLVEVAGQAVTLSETWEWDSTWTKRIENTNAIDRRHGHTLVYASALGQRALCLGGSLTSGPVQNVITVPLDSVRDYGPSYPASSESFGTQCGRAKIGLAASPPWIGRTVDVWWRAFAVNEGASLFVTGFSRSNWASIPLPLALTGLGTPNCNLYCSPDILLPIPQFVYRAKYPLPAQPSLLGAHYVHQIATLSNNKLEWSEGLELTIGER